ncbi:MAG: hypothetical protein ACE5JD_05540 [Candidatus Methylomirabilia bacterium]
MAVEEAAWGNPRDTLGAGRLAAVEARPRGLAPEGARARPSRVLKQRLTVHLPIELIDRAKDAVYWTPGLTLAGLAEETLTKALDAMEKERGEPVPPRREELRRGRPLK